MEKVEVFNKQGIIEAIDDLKKLHPFAEVKDSSFVGIYEFFGRRMPGETSLVPLGEVIYDSVAKVIFFLRK